MLGHGDLLRRALLDQLLDGRVLAHVVAVVVPGDHAREVDARLVDQRGELGVEDDRGRLLAVADLAELRRGEGGVEVEDVGAELRQRHRDVDEVAVVAAQHRDAVALVHAQLAQPVGQPGGALVDLLPGQLADLVDQRHLARRARGEGLDAAREAHAAGDERLRHAGQRQRAVGADHAGRGHHLDHARLAQGFLADLLQHRAGSSWCGG